ncbi:MAG: SRPBCC domain-containing protein [Steroidobacter sp.]
MKREIWHEIIINAEPDKVYQAITDPRQISHWWTTDTRGRSEVGGHLEFYFDDFLGAETRVTGLEVNKLVQWQCTDRGLPDWSNTKLEFKIFKEDGITYLHFKHSDWHENAAMFPHCSIGWAIFLMSLKEFVETGKGRPYPYDMPINMWSPPKKGGLRDLNVC